MFPPKSQGAGFKTTWSVFALNNFNVSVTKVFLVVFLSLSFGTWMFTQIHSILEILFWFSEARVNRYFGFWITMKLLRIMQVFPIELSGFGLSKYLSVFGVGSGIL